MTTNKFEKYLLSFPITFCHLSDNIPSRKKDIGLAAIYRVIFGISATSQKRCSVEERRIPKNKAIQQHFFSLETRQRGVH